MRRKAQKNSFLACAGLSIVTLLAILPFVSGCSKKETPPPAHPTPTPPIPRKIYDTARLFNGITLKSSVEATPSEVTSLHLEENSDSYQLRLELHLQVPKPAVSATDLLAATPELDTMLPDLDRLLQSATASPDFASLFDHKEKNLRANLGMLQKLLPRDTLYDCQTILDLRNTQNARRALLIQALMNVNADGSDGDRNLETEKYTLFFQPQTNYRWLKKTERHNPCLKDTEQHLAEIEEKLLDTTSLKETEKALLESRRADKKATLQELKHWSFLVGTSDPFIVLPSFMFSSTQGHPEIGDYAVVIARDTLYPAIVGDKGPNFKMGEASLRICREIDHKSTADSRPIDHPTVVYLVFPGTAEKPFTVPDYQHWSERCHALWKEFGGSDSATWHEWESLEKPWPTPTPMPTPSPTPSPTNSPLPMTTPGTNDSTFMDTNSNSITGTNPAAISTNPPQAQPTSSQSPAPTPQ